MKSTTGDVKLLKGDGLRVNVDLNNLNLKVSGDGCKVTVARNCGSIRVVGDGCSLKVNCNDGDIEYKGDGGSILLGVGSRTESVSYVGDGGRISVRKEKTGKTVRKEKKSAKVHDDGSKSRCSVSDSELEVRMENAANESKESKANGFVDDTNRGGGKRKEKTLRRSKTVIVTRISTEIPLSANSNDHGNLIKNWFQSPPTVLRSFKSRGESI